MDPYNLIQEQLATINNNLNQSLAKIHEDVGLLTKAVESLENKTRDHTVNFASRIEELENNLSIIPKIYNNQVSLIETQLVGHQYQFKRISNIITKDGEIPPFANITSSTGSSSNIPISGNPNNQNNGQNQQNNNQINSTTSAAANLMNAANGGISSQNRVNSPIPLNSQNRIHHANRVNQNQSQQINNIPLNRTTSTSQSSNPSSRRATTTTATTNSARNFMNVPSLDHEHSSISALSNSVMNPQRNSSNIVGPSGTGDSSDVLANTSSAQGTDNVGEVDDDEDDGLIDENNFHKLNPNPKSVQEVLDEYYFGYQGQPSLKYLEENQKRWRKGNKNLSKTFSRRYRIVTAVEMGIQIYSQEMGGNEALAKERVINELENTRNRENGGRETMYWLFHHIPEHLKRKR